MDAELLACMSGDDLEQLLARLDGVERAVRADKISVLQELARREHHRVDGARDMAEWYAARSNASQPVAREHVGAAERLRDLPSLHAALRDGTVSWCQAVRASRLASAVDDPEWVVWVSGLTPLQLDGMRVRRLRPDRAATRNGLRYRATPGAERVRYWGEAVGDDASAFLSAIEREADRDRDPAGTTDARTWTERCGDALVRLVLGEREPKATINVHLDESRLAGIDGDGWITPGDLPLPEWVLDRLACAARWRLVFDSRDGEPVAFTNAASPHPAVEAAVRRRDAHCRFPGCCGTRGQLHHVQWRSRRGKTTFDNLVLVCWRHHRLIHDHGWQLALDEDGHARWTTPGGRVLANAPPESNAA